LALPKEPNGAKVASEPGPIRRIPVNNRRLLEPIENIPPAEAEVCDYAQIKASAMAA
jgi:hypothetical protein